jgi:ubiquinone/menaquinone biosynthesis C-methylase UbiE
MEDGRQFGRPSGEEGRKILQDMNEHHRPLMAWALSKLPVISPAEILDIGCGGGMFLKMLSEAYPDAGMTGADISPEALALTRETNQEAVSSGRLVTVLASVSDLPFHGGVFDLVTAMETYFFWPDLAKGLAEAARPLRDGGCMLIDSEQYPHPISRRGTTGMRSSPASGWSRTGR